jgi:GNAT superfamily N-acetyltransferase
MAQHAIGSNLVPSFLRYNQKRDFGKLLTLNDRAMDSSPIGPTWKKEWNSSYRSIRQRYIKKGKGDFLVLYIGDAMVGMGGLEMKDGKTAMFRRLRIDPGFRGRRLAELFDSVRELRARELGYEYAELEIQTINIPRQKLAQKMGYVAAGGRSDGYGHEFIVYRKKL